MKINIENFLNAVVVGDLDTVQKYASYKNVHKARHPLTGGSALHMAILWDNTNVAYYLINDFQHLITSTDNVICCCVCFQYNKLQNLLNYLGLANSASLCVSKF